MIGYQRFLASMGLSICVAACDDAAGPSPSPEAVMLTAVSPTSLVATVGSAMADLPAVFAQDSRGNPVPGLAVLFTVEGGGFVVGSTATTNAAGVAKLAAWTIGTTPGVNKVTATSGALPPAMFTVTGVTGPPARLTKIEGDNQIAQRGQTLSIAPAVGVSDNYGNPVAGETVVFAMIGGGGSITGAESITDSNGIARLGSWTLGGTGGQAISASVGTLAPVYFTATVRDQTVSCLTSRIPQSSALTSSLDRFNCDKDGSYYEAFEIDVQDQRWLRFALESSEFDPVLELRDRDGRLIAGHTGSSPSILRALLPAGIFVVVAGTRLPGQSGNYRFVYEAGAAEANCDEPFVMRGVSRLQQMINKQCANVASWEDRYRIHLAANTRVTIRIDDRSYADPFVELIDNKGQVVKLGTQEGFYVDVLTFEAPAEGYYTIRVWSRFDEQIQYILTID